MMANEGVVDVFYSLPKRKTATKDKFLSAVARFAARAMDRIFRHEGINQVNVWAMGMIQLKEESHEPVWRGVKLTLGNKSQGYIAGKRSLSHLADTDLKKYLNICNLRWVNEGAILSESRKYSKPLSSLPPFSHPLS